MLLDPELQQAIAEAYACAPQDVLILHTLEINHKTFNRPACVARWSGVGPEVEVFRCRLEGNALYNPGEVVEFVGLPFELVPPEKSETTPGEISLRVSGIGYELDNDLEAAALGGSAISCIYRSFIHGEELKGPAEVWPGITLTGPSSEGADNMTATGAVLNWINRKYGRKYTPEGYPGLVDK